MFRCGVVLWTWVKGKGSVGVGVRSRETVERVVGNLRRLILSFHCGVFSIDRRTAARSPDLRPEVALLVTTTAKFVVAAS